jgi:L1 cell adhesion molecule like protein
LLGRTNVKADPSKAFDECEDFLLTVVEGLIVTAAMQILDMKSLDDVPHSNIIPQNSWLCSDSERKNLLARVTKEIFVKYVKVCYCSDNNFEFQQDKTTQYQAELLRIGLFYCEFRDSIKEGDGERALRCWRYLLPIFFNTNRTNYSREALYLLCQHKYLLTKRQSLQLMYSRFVNTQEGKGNNIPCDLHMEHLNKVCKECIRDLGPNKTTASIQQVARCIGTIDTLMNAFDSENAIKFQYGTHKKANCTNDITLLSEHLMKYEVLIPHQTKRTYPSFKSPKNLLSTKNDQKLLQYMTANLPDRYM